MKNLSNVQRWIAVVVVAALIGLVVALFAGGGGHNAAKPAAPQVNKSAYLAWYNGQGYTDFQNVSNDLTQSTQDAQANNVIASEVDGQNLAADAQTALDNPMPIDTTQYTNAMQDFVIAGNDASSGDFSDATTYLNDATVNLNVVDSTIQGLLHG